MTDGHYHGNGEAPTMEYGLLHEGATINQDMFDIHSWKCAVLSWLLSPKA
ncbi:hypothetical protein CPC08DRAFT_710247 [Agrocybe pediades]|nr:hypothetical protein CPC08DRAFT_710247 [Agrocybe pediades]